MSSINDGNEPVLKSTGSIESLGWSTLEKLYLLFTKLWTPVQLFLAAVGILRNFRGLTASFMKVGRHGRKF